MPKYNNLQMIAWEISGYALNDDEWGQQNDSYYATEKEARRNFIQDYAFCRDGIEPVSHDEACRIQNYLDEDFISQSYRHHSFMELK